MDSKSNYAAKIYNDLRPFLDIASPADIGLFVMAQIQRGDGKEIDFELTPMAGALLKSSDDIAVRMSESHEKRASAAKEAIARKQSKSNGIAVPNQCSSNGKAKPPSISLSLTNTSTNTNTNVPPVDGSMVLGEDNTKMEDNPPLPPAAPEPLPAEGKPPRKRGKRGEPANVDVIRDMITAQAFDEPLNSAVVKWFEYKRVERRKAYQPMGAQSQLAQIRSNALKYGQEAMADAIEKTIGNQYDGIVWDYAARTVGARASPSSKAERSREAIQNIDLRGIVADDE